MTKQSSSKCLSPFGLQIIVSISCLFSAVSSSPVHAQSAAKARPYAITLGELFSPSGAEGLADEVRSLQQPCISASADFGSAGAYRSLTFAAFADFAVPASITHHHDTADYFNGIAPGTTRTTSSTVGIGVSTHYCPGDSCRNIRPYIGAGLGIYRVHMHVVEREQSIVGNDDILPLTGLNYQTNTDVTRSGIKLNTGIETRSGLLFQIEALILLHKDRYLFDGGPFRGRPDGTSYSIGYRF